MLCSALYVFIVSTTGRASDVYSRVWSERNISAARTALTRKLCLHGRPNDCAAAAPFLTRQSIPSCRSSDTCRIVRRSPMGIRRDAQTVTLWDQSRLQTVSEWVSSFFTALKHNKSHQRHSLNGTKHVIYDKKSLQRSRVLNSLSGNLVARVRMLEWLVIKRPWVRLLAVSLQTLVPAKGREALHIGR